MGPALAHRGAALPDGCPGPLLPGWGEGELARASGLSDPLWPPSPAEGPSCPARSLQDLHATAGGAASPHQGPRGWGSHLRPGCPACVAAPEGPPRGVPAPDSGWLAPVPTGPLGGAARGQRPGRVAPAARGQSREPRCHGLRGCPASGAPNPSWRMCISQEGPQACLGWGEVPQLCPPVRWVWVLLSPRGTGKPSRLEGRLRAASVRNDQNPDMAPPLKEGADRCSLAYCPQPCRVQG